MTHLSVFVNGGSGLARPPSPRLEESPHGDEEGAAVVPKRQSFSISPTSRSRRLRAIWTARLIY